MAGQLRPNLPPLAEWPLESWNVGKKGSKKSFFPYWPGPLPHPVLMALQLRRELFFAASLTMFKDQYFYMRVNAL